MTRQVSPVITMLTPEKLENFKASNPVVVIMETHVNSPEYNEFHKVADKLHYNFMFGIVESAIRRLTIYKKFDEGVDEFVGAYNEQEINRFLLLYGKPIVPTVSPNNYEELFARGLPLPHFYYENLEQKNQFSAEIERIAKKFQEDFQFVYMDVSKFRGVVNAHGLLAPFPAFTIVDGKSGTVYYHGRGSALKIDGLEDLLANFKLGLVKPTLRSEPEPKTNDGPVIEVVGSSFDRIVMDPKKDVLIVFYSRIL